MMNYSKSKYLNTPYQYPLLDEYCNNLNLKERLDPNYEAVKSIQEKPLAFDNPTTCSHVPGVLDTPQLPCPSNFGLKPMSYSKVHPKKKMRMAYDKEIADAHSTFNAVTRTRRESYTDSAISSSPSSKIYTPIAPHFPNRDEVKNLSDPHRFGSLSPRTKYEINYRHLVSRLPQMRILSQEHFAPPASSLSDSWHLRDIPCHQNLHRRFSDYGQRNSCSYPPQKHFPILERDLNGDKPQDLRVGFSEELKKVARGICNSNSLPELNIEEIPIASAYPSPSPKGKK